MPGGRLVVEWSWASNERLVLRWIETGGPAVRKPSRQGFGSELIEVLTRQLGGETSFEWCAQGLVCELDLPATTFESVQAAAQ